MSFPAILQCSSCCNLRFCPAFASTNVLPRNRHLWSLRPRSNSISRSLFSDCFSFFFLRIWEHLDCVYRIRFGFVFIRSVYSKRQWIVFQATSSSDTETEPESNNDRVNVIDVCWLCISLQSAVDLTIYHRDNLRRFASSDTVPTNIVTSPVLSIILELI